MSIVKAIIRPNIFAASIRHIKRPHQRVSCYGESLFRRAYKQVLPVSALDIATDLEFVELLIPDEILTHPPMSDPSLPLINDTDPTLVLPKPEAKLNAPPLPPANEHVGIVTFPPLLTNDSPPTIVTAPSLLSDDNPDVKLNNPPLPSDDTPMLIKTDPPVLLSPEPTSTITDSPAPDDVTPVLVKTLPLSPFAEFPLFNLTDAVLLSQRV